MLNNLIESFQSFAWQVASDRDTWSFLHLPNNMRNRMNINTGRDPLLDSLDCPAPSVLTPVRQQTITPLQALGLMNDTFVLRQAASLAEQIRGLETPNDQIDSAWRRTLGRSPSDHEIATALDVLANSDLATLCWVLLNTSEFLQIR